MDKTYKKIFSFGYPSFSKNPSQFYETLKNSTQQYRDEIFDIYFSVPYNYIFNNNEYSYGDVMGAPITEEDLYYILKIKNELNIEVSLTFNETYPNRELIEDFNILNGFIAHIKKFYDAGVRSCTISHVHMMVTGILQRSFPEMKWKNTVNHIITSPQQVVDYYLIGYDIINLDRSLNRNIDMLKSIQGVRKKYPNLILSLLVTEGCMPNCPFKVEHDTMNKNVGWNYWTHHGNMTCKIWRHQEFNDLPRLGTEMVWGDKETFDEYSQYVDYFKFSGRMCSLPKPSKDGDKKFIWSNIAHIKGQLWLDNNWDMDKVADNKEIKYAFFNSFSEMINNSNGVVSNFRPGRYIDVNAEEMSKDIESIDSETIWSKKSGQALNKILKNCKNECWNCHACEETFGAPKIDSLIEVNRDVSFLRGHTDHFKGIKDSN